LEQTRKFTINELAEFNGKNGKPEYVCYTGKVYDVTGSIQWIDDDHTGHTAGEELIAQMKIAPHGEEVMERRNVVGVLA
jgi:predicted heme/steroid binding protein